MKKVNWVIGVFAFLVGLHSAGAADLTGTWKGAFDFQGTPVPLTFHLTSAAGGAVTGNIEGLPTGAVDIHDGKVDGDSLTFWVNTEYQGAAYKIVYKGKITAGQIDFSFGTEDGSWSSTMTVKNDAAVATPATTATPALATVAGNWKGAFDFQGTSIPLTFHLTVAAGVVTGTVEGLPTTPAEIHDGKVDGDAVTFSVTTDYQGTPVKLVYKGKVAADGIKFEFGTEDGSWGTVLTAVKSS